MKDFLFNSQKILSRKRSPWVDYARGICIILVVYRHIFEGLANVGEGSYSYDTLKYLNIFFFSFRMPLFFIVSGIFLGGSLMRKTTGEYISGRFNTIFYPLLIWGSIQITLQLAFAGQVNADRTPLDYLHLIYDPRKIEQFWYLNALFCVSALYVVFKHYLRFNTVQQLILGIFFYVMAGVFRINEFHIGFMIDVLFFYLFFAIGDLISDLVLKERNYKILSSFKTFFIILPVFVALQHYFTMLNLENQDDYYVQFLRPELYSVTALVGCAFVINISFVLQRLNTARVLRIIGYHSLYIYVMHLIITAGIRVVMIKVFHIDNVLVLMVVSVTLGVALPIMLYNIIERMGGWWLFTGRRPNKVKPTAKNDILLFHRELVTPRESEQAASGKSGKQN